MELAEHPRTRPGVVGAILVAVAVAIVVRVFFGVLLDDPIHPVTYWGMVGGALGAVLMIAINQQISTDDLATVTFWATYLGDGDPSGYFRQGAWLHVTYFVVVAGFYARIFRKIVAVTGAVFADFPLAVLTGVAFGVLAFVPSLVYVVTGIWEVDLEPRPILEFFGLHLAYGLAVGVVASLWRPVFGPLFGVV